MFPALKNAEQKLMASNDVAHIAKYLTILLRGDGQYEQGAIAKAERAPERVVEWIKTASPALQQNTSNQFALALDRFLMSNTPRGAFDTMRPAMTEVPIHTRVMLNSSALPAGEVAEGGAKPVRRLDLTVLDTEVTKCVSQFVISREAVIEYPTLVARMIASALPEAVSKAVDTYFIGKLATQEIGESSGEVNPSWALALSDIEELLRNVATGEASRLWLILTPRAAKYLARLATENGISTLGWSGGTIMGVNVIASAAQTTNRLTLADASAIAYADGGTEIRQSEVAAIEMLDNPTNASGPSVTATNLVSMFQTNSRALLAERRVAVRVVDVDSVVSLSGAQWGVGADSPAMA